MDLTSDINCPPREVVDVIQRDPVLMMNLLKLVNSSYFGLSQSVTSVNHAVVYIGINTVKNIALLTAALGVLPRKNKAGFNIDDFLLHSLSTAAISKTLAKKVAVPERELSDFFLCGLLHDFGKIVFTNFLPGEYQKTLLVAKEQGLPLYEAEMQVLETDHAQVGSLLAEKWRLPSPVVECIKNHHCRDSRQQLMTDAVFAANQISKKTGTGYSGDNIVQELPDKIYDLLGAEDIENVILSLGDVTATLDKSFLRQ
ncbi:MAG: HDOD domain-containing protein [Syntrophales bacterium]|nr:HDOD domain-containing protein [Syntrophales bacterium]